MPDIISLTEAISNVGFPIAVAGYLLLSFEKTVKENTKALVDLRAVIGPVIKNRVLKNG